MYADRIDPRCPCLGGFTRTVERCVEVVGDVDFDASCEPGWKVPRHIYERVAYLGSSARNVTENVQSSKRSRWFRGQMQDAEILIVLQCSVNSLSQSRMRAYTWFSACSYPILVLNECIQRFYVCKDCQNRDRTWLCRARHGEVCHEDDISCCVLGTSVIDY